VIVNVCSGVPVTIRDLLRAVLTEVGGNRARGGARSASAAPGRPDDLQWLVGNPTRFIDLTGNTPQRIPLSRTVADAIKDAE
jgi:hypothetical protein